MCWEPRRACLPDLGGAFFGSLMLLYTRSVRVAIQFFRLMALIVPTKTSATITLLLPFMASVSGIWT